MNKEEKLKYGLEDKAGKQNEELIELFKKERYEYLLKGIFATTTSQTCSGQIQNNHVNHGMGNIYSHNHFLLDQNKYEDYARILLGPSAYLMFQIEKIVS